MGVIRPDPDAVPTRAEWFLVAGGRVLMAVCLSCWAGFVAVALLGVDPAGPLSGLGALLVVGALGTTLLLPLSLLTETLVWGNEFSNR